MLFVNVLHSNMHLQFFLKLAKIPYSYKTDLVVVRISHQNRTRISYNGNTKRMLQLCINSSTIFVPVGKQVLKHINIIINGGSLKKFILITVCRKISTMFDTLNETEDFEKHLYII